MDYRNILATAAVIFASAHFVRSFQPANAAPNGPVISTGSNPIENINGSSQVNNTPMSIWTNTTSDDLIITTALLSTGYSCRLAVNGSNDGLAQLSYAFDVYANSSSYNLRSTVFTTGSARLKVAPGESIYMRSNSSSNRTCDYYIEGYYAHP